MTVQEIIVRNQLLERGEEAFNAKEVEHLTPKALQNAAMIRNIENRASDQEESLTDALSKYMMTGG